MLNLKKVLFLSFLLLSLAALSRALDEAEEVDASLGEDEDAPLDAAEGLTDVAEDETKVNADEKGAKPAGKEEPKSGSGMLDGLFEVISNAFQSIHDYISGKSVSEKGADVTTASPEAKTTPLAEEEEAPKGKGKKAAAKKPAKPLSVMEDEEEE